ncbi:hypothetical protein [Leptospira sp. B5-022]|uniref:hypothetical protein n=1 Tax=Leptospira sp. B5-022 TaxID=1242992 RepID=UPI00034A07C8|nr:hypothetical protein [Leptospira sp. B5-022]
MAYGTFRFVTRLAGQASRQVLRTRETSARLGRYTPCPKNLSIKYIMKEDISSEFLLTIKKSKSLDAETDSKTAYEIISFLNSEEDYYKKLEILKNINLISAAIRQTKVFISKPLIEFISAEIEKFKSISFNNLDIKNEYLQIIVTTLLNLLRKEDTFDISKVINEFESKEIRSLIVAGVFDSKNKYIKDIISNHLDFGIKF